MEKVFIPFLWIFGGMAFSIFTFTSDTYREKTFFKHISKIKSENEYCYHIGSLIDEIWHTKGKKTDKVNGYVHMHKMYCMDPSCPLKEDIRNFKSEKKCKDKIAKAKQMRLEKFIEYSFVKGLNR